MGIWLQKHKTAISKVRKQQKTPQTASVVSSSSCIAFSTTTLQEFHRGGPIGAGYPEGVVLAVAVFVAPALVDAGREIGGCGVSDDVEGPFPLLKAEPSA